MTKKGQRLNTKLIYCGTTHDKNCPSKSFDCYFTRCTYTTFPAEWNSIITIYTKRRVKCYKLRCAYDLGRNVISYRKFYYIEMFAFIITMKARMKIPTIDIICYNTSSAYYINSTVYIIIYGCVISTKT